MVSARRNADAARAFFTRALHQAPAPVEVTTDRAPVYSRVLEEVACSARHVTEQHANNTIEADHGRLKARLRPMRGLKCARSLQTVAAGHAFLQNLRRGHYELTIDHHPNQRARVAFHELAASLLAQPADSPQPHDVADRRTQQSRQICLGRGRHRRSATRRTYQHHGRQSPETVETCVVGS